MAVNLKVGDEVRFAQAGSDIFVGKVTATDDRGMVEVEWSPSRNYPGIMHLTTTRWVNSAILSKVTRT